MILKNFWAHRRQNGFVFVEIALIAVLSFYLLDHITVLTYSNYFCRADGEFEKEHLLVGQTARLTPITTEELQTEAEAYTDTARLKPFEREALKVMSSLYAFRDEVRTLPEVQSVCLTQQFVGDGLGMWNHHALAPETDTTKTCSAYMETFCLNKSYFETLGMTAVKAVRQWRLFPATYPPTASSSPAASRSSFSAPPRPSAAGWWKSSTNLALTTKMWSL